MQIAVISDTHMPRGARALPDACVERLRDADLILHAGDLTGATFLDELFSFGPPVAAVHGNMDEAAVRERLPEDRVVDAAGAIDLAQVGALLRGGAVYIGGDTSITHLAAACEVAVVALYGPIDPRCFGPWPASATLDVPYVSHAPVQRVGNVTVLQGTPPCVPCNRAGCEDRNDSVSVCLLSMAPARVVAEVDRILDRARAAEGQ